MQTAKGTLKLNVFNTIEVTGITPAEAVILNTAFTPKGGGLEGLQYTGETDEDPMPKLRNKYAKGAFAKAFPGGMPRLPKTFAEVKLKVAGVPAPAAKKE